MNNTNSTSRHTSTWPQSVKPSFKVSLIQYSMAIPHQKIRISKRGGLRWVEYLLRLRCCSEPEDPPLDVVFVSIDLVARNLRRAVHQSSVSQRGWYCKTRHSTAGPCSIEASYHQTHFNSTVFDNTTHQQISKTVIIQTSKNVCLWKRILSQTIINSLCIKPSISTWTFQPWQRQRSPRLLHIKDWWEKTY